MRRFSITLPVSLVLSMLVSVTAGFAYPSYGWHNGLMFLLMFAVIVLSVQKIKSMPGPTAVAGLIPLYMEILAAVVVSALCGFVGIHLGGGEQNFADLAYYVLSVALVGFVAVCASVNYAVRAKDALVSPVFKQVAVYAVAFVAGLIAVAVDSESHLAAAVVCAVICAVLSVWLISGASKGSYY